MKNSHGGNIYQAATLLGCLPHQIIDFSSNINTVRPKVKLGMSTEILAPYANTSYSDLKKDISLKYHIGTREIALFNGASAAIFELLRSLAPSELFLYAPLYSEYKKAASLFAKNTHLINRFDDLYQDPKQGSTVVFVNPSTPDGLYYDLERLFDIWKSQECTVILDESFIEFTSHTSARDKILDYDKLYIIQSFTKYYGFAGMRIGAIFSRSSNLDKLIIPAWNLSTFDVQLLQKALQDTRHDAKSHAAQSRHYAKLLSILTSALITKKVYPGSANYILIQTHQSASLLAARLLEAKILVRDCSNFDYLGKDHLRFAVKETKALIKLKKALDALS